MLNLGWIHGKKTSETNWWKHPMNSLFIPFIPYININHLDCLTSHFDLRRGLVCKSSSNALLYAMMCTASLYVGGSQIFYRKLFSGGPRNSLDFGSLWWQKCFWFKLCLSTQSCLQIFFKFVCCGYNMWNWLIYKLTSKAVCFQINQVAWFKLH